MPTFARYFLFSIFLLGIMQPMEAQDWPNLNRYKQANEQLQKEGTSASRVVFMGNSITEGWLQANPAFFENKPYINRGIGGQTTPQMLLRFRQDVIALQPKVVLILAGTNDIAENTGPITLEQIRDNMLSMVQLAKANGIVPIVCSVLPAYDYPWRPGKAPNVKIPQLNELLKQLCKKEDVPYLDYFAEMTDSRNGLPKALTTDEVHLTKAGYSVMEELAENAILAALKS